MNRIPRGRDVLAALSLSIAVAAGCGEGTNDFTDASPVADGTTPLSEAADGVPVIGQLLSDCLEDGTVVFVEFVQTDSFDPILDNTQLEGITDLEALLVDEDDALGLPILAGITPEGGISQQEAIALLEDQGGQSAVDASVLGFAPVTCNDGLVPADLTALGDYNETIGAIPVFGAAAQDGSVELQGFVLGVIGENNSSAPGEATFPTTFQSFQIPAGGESGLDPLASVIQSILAVLMPSG